jgi:hypothetical protein
MSEDLKQLPGESLVQFYNRKLKVRGRHDIEWFVDPRDDRMKLRSRGAAKRFDLADPE